MGIKIQKSFRFSSDLLEKIKGYALMENKSETQFVIDCITSYITHKVPADNFLAEMKKMRLEIKKLRLEIQEKDSQNGDVK